MTINFYEEINNISHVNAYIPEGSYNFVDFDKYSGTPKIIQSKYDDEKDNISEICRCLNLEGVIIC